MQTLLTILLAISVLAGLLRLARPVGMRIEGEVFLRTSVPLLARLRMHAATSVAGLILALVLIVAFGMAPLIVLVPIVSYLILAAIPVTYTLTTAGIRVGWTRFRRWTEFAGVSRARGGASLQGVHGSRSLRIWLSGSRGDDEFLHLLRHAIKQGYKGQNRTEIVSFGDSAERMADDPTIITI
ncbi:MAG TPA: hypothetical protein VFQ54_02070 [Thermomicrobiales bacterium]|nr:hypothetical protein [Thermomicrobiales bacterium]